MKVLIFGLALFVSAIALADECPSLAGNYQCEGYSNITKVKEVVKDGVVYYKINNTIYKADGSESIETKTIDDMNIVIHTTSSCVDSTLVTDLWVNEVGSTNAFHAVNAKFSTDVFGDLVVQMTVSEDGVAKRTIQTCEKL